MFMDFDHNDEKRRRQFIKVVIAELGMVIAVIAIVIVATLASMGFFVNSDWTIEQSGLLQLHSLPTGASVELDGETLFFRTNLSRTMAEGKHTLKLSREGYDSWQKVINMRPGVLLRVYYPRLFLQNRTPATVMDLGKDLAFYAASRDRTTILYANQKSARWNLVDLKGDEVKTTTLDLTEVLPGVENGAFAGKVTEVKWSNNSDRVLVKVSYNDKNAWVMVDLRDVKASLNLTDTFGMEFQQIELVNGSMGQLFALRDHQLYRIDVADRKMSGVLLNNIEAFASYGANLIYLARVKDDEVTVQKIGIYKDGEKGGTILKTVPAGTKVRIALTNYYDQDYVAMTLDNRLTVLYGKLPTYTTNDETGVMSLEPLLDNVELVTVPTSLAVSPGGEYLLARHDKQLMVVDAETGELHEYEAPTAQVAWFDDSMLYVVADQSLQVWDFDNTNQRTLIEFNMAEQDVKTPEQDFKVVEHDTAATEHDQKYELRDFPVVVAANERWLYYVVQDDTELVMMREKIRD